MLRPCLNRGGPFVVEISRKRAGLAQDRGNTTNVVETEDGQASFRDEQCGILHITYELHYNFPKLPYPSKGNLLQGKKTANLGPNSKRRLGPCFASTKARSLCENHAENSGTYLNSCLAVYSSPLSRGTKAYLLLFAGSFTGKCRFCMLQKHQP